MSFFHGRGLRLTLGSLVLVIAFAAGSASATSSFEDVAGNGHSDNIEAIYKAGITLGCGADTYCPASPVRRDQMASFLARAMGLSSGTTKNFPKANARSQVQAYCALGAASPGSFQAGPCQPSSMVIDGESNGYRTSMAIGTDGFPVIGYAHNGGIAVAHCTTTSCAAATTTNVIDGEFGAQPSLAIGIDGFPVFSYRDQANGTINVVHCQDIACNSHTDTVAAESTFGVPALAIGASGFPVISFPRVSDDVNQGLWVLRCVNVACTSGSQSNIDTRVLGSPTSIAIGADGRPIIGYFDGTTQRFRIARCSDSQCEAASSIEVGPEGRELYGAAVAIGVDGRPIASFVDRNDLNFARCTDPTCAAVETSVLHSLGSPGLPSIAIGTNGFPVISFSNMEKMGEHLYFMRCSDRACTSPSVQEPDGPTRSGIFGSSIVVGIDGLPLIAAGYPLKLVHPAVV